MTLRTIVTLPDPVLRRKAKPVTRFDADLQTLVDDIIETMRAAPGVGLAAPQLSAPLRVIVVEYPEDDQDEASPKKLYVLINPEIVKVSAEAEVGVEGCLSVPALVGEVERPLAVTVRGLNRRGQPRRLKARGWLARIFQHEVDHINGIVFSDRAARLWTPQEPIEDNV